MIEEVPRVLLPVVLHCPRHEHNCTVERGWIVRGDYGKRDDYVTLGCGCTLRSDDGKPVLR